MSLARLAIATVSILLFFMTLLQYKASFYVDGPEEMLDGPRCNPQERISDPIYLNINVSSLFTWLHLTAVSAAALKPSCFASRQNATSSPPVLDSENGLQAIFSRTARRIRQHPNPQITISITLLSLISSFDTVRTLLSSCATYTVGKTISLSPILCLHR